MSLIAVATGT